MRSYLCVLLILSCCSLAAANDGAIWGVGGTVEPIKEHGSVRMVKERVTAVLDSDYAKVSCDFVFKNDGPATSVQMGFPESGNGAKTGRVDSSCMADFRSWVNGKLTPTKFVLVKPMSEQYEGYHGWHVKDVPFAAGETVRVRDSYRSDLGSRMAETADSPMILSFSYVLMTGKSWKGRIGEAVVEVDVSRVERFFRIRPEPKGYKKSAHKLTWTFKNFQPTGDISIDLVQIQPILNGKALTDSYGVRDGVMIAGLSGLSKRHLVKVWRKWRKSGGDSWTVIRGRRTLILHHGKTTATLNGKPLRLSAAPFGPWADVDVPIIDVVRALGGSAYFGKKSGALYLDLPRM